MGKLGVGVLVGALAVTGAACRDDAATSDATRPTAPTSPAPTTTTTAPRPRVTSTTVAADLGAARIALAPVATGLDSPVALAWRNGDPRIFVAEQGGRLRAIDARGRVSPEPLLTLAVSHGNEQGLLGVAFSPDGSRLYVDYTDPAGDTHVDEYAMRGDDIDTGSRREVLVQDQPYRNHNGGQLLFGPDGMLYVTFGDGGSAGDPHDNAQDLGTLLGKIVRIDPRPSGASPYSAPADNPFVGRPGARSEVWMYGLRNPWRMSFDRERGDVWIGDVGQNRYEEIDYVPAGEAAGANWGWPGREGAHDFRGGAPPGARDPVIENGRENGECAIVGGYVYRGDAIPNLRGVYLWGDNCASPLLGAVVRDGRVVQQRQVASVSSLTTFGEDPQGELYVASRGGTVYRIVRG